jgi:hypothetical protein
MAVQGPGVQAGVIDSTLLDVTDILPTLADLAGLRGSRFPTAKPWDGVSFKNLVLAGPGSQGGRRGDVMASSKQKDRMVFTLGPACWDGDAVPALGPDRCVESTVCYTMWYTHLRILGTHVIMQCRHWQYKAALRHELCVTCYCTSPNCHKLSVIAATAGL